MDSRWLGLIPVLLSFLPGCGVGAASPVDRAVTPDACVSTRTEDHPRGGAAAPRAPGSEAWESVAQAGPTPWRATPYLAPPQANVVPAPAYVVTPPSPQPAFHALPPLPTPAYVAVAPLPRQPVPGPHLGVARPLPRRSPGSHVAVGPLPHGSAPSSHVAIASAAPHRSVPTPGASRRPPPPDERVALRPAHDRAGSAAARDVHVTAPHGANAVATPRGDDRARSVMASPSKGSPAAPRDRVAADPARRVPRLPELRSPPREPSLGGRVALR